LNEFSKQINMTLSKLPIQTECVNNVTDFVYEKNGLHLTARLYDGCDVSRVPVHGNYVFSTFTSYFLVYPVWNKTDSKINYFIDTLGSNKTSDRVSVFYNENRQLIGKFYSDNGVTYEVPIDVSDWNPYEWALIMYGSNPKQVSLVYLNIPNWKLKMNFVNVTDYNLEISNASAYIGSDAEGKNQAYAVIANVPDEWIGSNNLPTCVGIQNLA